MSFTKFQFKKYISEALEELKFTTPTEVQDKLIPIVLTGRDLSVNQKQVRVRLTLSYCRFSSN